jgi:hypothetical protein
LAQYLGIHRGDRFETLVSMSSMERMLSLLRDKLPADNPARSEKYVCGDINTSIIRTALGRTILVQYDTVTPRPYTRLNMISGTGGAFADYPPRICLRGKKLEWETDITAYQEKYQHPLWKTIKDSALRSGGHGGMDYVMNWRLAQCLLGGMELDLSVYDAAAWSSVFPLSIASVARGSIPVSVPDFTRGRWNRGNG